MRFAPTAYDNQHGSLFKLTQTSTVSAYLVEFEFLANWLVGLSLVDMLSYVILGLKMEIHREVLARQASSISQATGLNRLQL